MENFQTDLLTVPNNFIKKKTDFHFILGAVDVNSKFFFIHALKNKKFQEIEAGFSSIFLQIKKLKDDFGTISSNNLTFHSDHGYEFVNPEIKRFFQEHGNQLFNIGFVNVSKVFAIESTFKLIQQMLAVTITEIKQDNAGYIKVSFW